MTTQKLTIMFSLLNVGQFVSHAACLYCIEFKISNCVRMTEDFHFEAVRAVSLSLSQSVCMFPMVVTECMRYRMQIQIHFVLEIANISSIYNAMVAE